MQRAERRTLWIPLVTSLIVATSALIGAGVTGSQTVLLDGLFSVAYVIAGAFTLYVARLLRRPSDVRFPYGYAAFEPLVNLVKGLLLMGISVYAFWEAVSALTRGGREIEFGGAVAFSAFSFGVSTVAALLIWWRSRTVNSPLIRGDAIGSALDALSTLTVLIAFVLGGWLHAQGQEALARYMDPVLTVGLVLVTLPVPYRLGREALSQLLAQTPPAEQRARVEQAVQEGLWDAPVQTLEIKTIKVGRQWDVRVQATLETQASTLTVSEADDFRRAVQERLETLDEEVQVAVMLLPSGAPDVG